MSASELERRTSVAPAAMCLPNFLYIGTSKAGSTWIYDVLSAHPDVFIAPGKGTYFFSHHFDRGFAWYGEHFSSAAGRSVVGEISHAYLYSEEAAEQIAAAIPAVNLMVCLREPIERAFSAYLDLVKNDRFAGTFEESLEFNSDILTRGKYSIGLQPYLQRFARNHIHIGIFDDLKANAQHFADEMFRFLGLQPQPLPPKMRQKMMPAARARSAFAMHFAKKSARFLEQIGFKQLRGRLKRSRWVRHALYQPYDRLPEMSPSTKARLREYFRDDVVRLDEMLDLQLVKRWGYD